MTYNIGKGLDEQEDRIRKTEMERDEMILQSDIIALKRAVNDSEMALRIVDKKDRDVHAEKEDLERKLKKAEEDLRLKEEEHKDLRKRIQTIR